MTSRLHTYHPSEHLPGPLAGGGIALIVIAVIMLGMVLPGMVGLSSDVAMVGPLIIPLLAAVIFLIWTNERIWIMMGMVGHLMMMVDSTREGIGPGEAGFTAIGLCGLAFWFVKEVAVYRRQIVQTGFDLLLISFMLISTFTTLLACVLHGGDLMLYFKEYGSMFDLLFYFPIRKLLRNREDVVLLLVLFVTIAFANGLYSFASYRERLAQAVFQWQITASRSNVNESTSMALLVMAATLFAYAKKFWLQIASLGLVAASIIFLLISFSRGPIVAGMLGVGVTILLIPWRNSRKVVMALGLSMILGIGTAYVLFPQIVGSIGSSISERILSISSTSSDRSFNARLVESGTVLDKYIRYSPMIGDGFGVRFSFLDPITNTTQSGTFVHNGYIWMLFKYGIPLALILLGILVYPLLRLLMKAPARHSGFNRALMAGSVGYLASALMVHFTSNHLAQVATTLNFAICWVLLDYIGKAAAGPVPERPIAHLAPAGA